MFHFIEKVEFGFTILLAGKHTVQHTGEAVNSPTPIEVGELMEEPDTWRFLALAREVPGVAGWSHGKWQGRRTT